LGGPGGNEVPFGRDDFKSLWVMMYPTDANKKLMATAVTGKVGIYMRPSSMMN
jgi:hypothetical protein